MAYTTDVKLVIPAMSFFMSDFFQSKLAKLIFIDFAIRNKWIWHEAVNTEQIWYYIYEKQAKTGTILNRLPLIGFPRISTF